MRDLNAMEMTLVSGGFFNGDDEGEDKPKEEDERVVEDVIVVMGTTAAGSDGWHYGLRGGAAVGAWFGPVGAIAGAAAGGGAACCALTEPCRKAIKEVAENAGDETAGRHLRDPSYIPATPIP